jgi:phosphohistidine phosphatase
MPDMRHLMLLRHAKTENEAPSGRDQDRRLDERGRMDAAAIGTWMGQHPPFAGAVMVSPAVRARQTWEIAWEAMKAHAPTPDVEFVPALYGADPGRLLEIIRSSVASDPKRLMLVGHNPGLHELALALIANDDNAGRKTLSDNLPTAGLAMFEFDGDDWSDVGFRRGRLAMFVSPKLLRQTLGE